MEKEQSLLVAMKYTEEANNMLIKANNILKNMGNDEDSLIGQGILRNLNHLREHIGNKIIVERIEMAKKKETEIEE